MLCSPWWRGKRRVRWMEEGDRRVGEGMKVCSLDRYVRVKLRMASNIYSKTHSSFPQHPAATATFWRYHFQRKSNHLTPNVNRLLVNRIGSFQHLKPYRRWLGMTSPAQNDIPPKFELNFILVWKWSLIHVNLQSGYVSHPNISKVRNTGMQQNVSRSKLLELLMIILGRRKTDRKIVANRFILPFKAIETDGIAAKIALLFLCSSMFLWTLCTHLLRRYEAQLEAHA